MTQEQLIAHIDKCISQQITPELIKTAEKSLVDTNASPVFAPFAALMAALPKIIASAIVEYDHHR